jgi:hypothetical protein
MLPAPHSNLSSPRRKRKMPPIKMDADPLALSGLQIYLGKTLQLFDRARHA